MSRYDVTYRDLETNYRYTDVVMCNTAQEAVDITRMKATSEISIIRVSKTIHHWE